jgi:SAM-dependent methyltransferase
MVMGRGEEVHHFPATGDAHWRASQSCLLVVWPSPESGMQQWGRLMKTNDVGYKGYKDYTSRFLKIYDRFVVGFMVPRVWKTTAEPGLALYEAHLGRRHLDVGPGTGYYISVLSPPTDIALTLVDPNPDVLDHCAASLAAWDPALVEANVLEPLPVEGPFESASLAHVIHCLPGPMADKGRAIEHIAAVLSDDGVLFGGTVLGLSAGHTLAARTFLRIANLQGGFDNLDDSIDGLRAILEASFEDVVITEPTASIAYFVASRPRGRGSTDREAGPG